MRHTLPSHHIGERILQSDKAAAHTESDVSAHKGAHCFAGKLQRHKPLRGIARSTKDIQLPKCHLSSLSHWVLCGVLGHGQHLNILNSTEFSPAARQRQGKAMLEGLYVIHVTRSSDRKIASCSQSQKPVKIAERLLPAG